MEKTAVTLVGPVSVKMQVGLVPAQSPRHSRKTAPGVGVALRATMVPGGKLALQVAPQLSPAGLDVTVPSALPALATARETRGMETVTDRLTAPETLLAVRVYVVVTEGLTLREPEAATGPMP